MNTTRASARGIETIDRLRQLKGWNRQSQAWCQEAFTTLATLRRFWQREPIQQETFIRICQAVNMERWEEIVEGAIPANVQLIRSEGMPDVSIFYGRTDELAKLTQWITTDRCRLIALLGMGGIGKSALAVKLAEQLAPQFEKVIWRSLRYTSSIEKLLAELTQLLSKQTEQDPSHSIETQVSSLIEGLQRHRALLVLDGWETVLSSGDFAGHYREGYKRYGEIIQRVGQETHESCLLLTSREKTPEISLLEGRTAPVRSLSLAGLGEAAREIFGAEGLADEEQWSRLIQIYRGNPLVLQVIATFVRELFGGSVTDFLRQGGTLITGDLNHFLKQLFERLSSLEIQMMQQLANAQEPILLQQLREALPTISNQDLLGALQSLWWRSLIERSAIGEFTLQPIIAEYTIHYLKWLGSEEESS
jgi:ABC-type dipeptide/oligopeptide/nickel transport system ATPase subunit